MADPPKGGASKPLIPPPPPAALRAKDGLPPKLPEIKGVVTGASTTAPSPPRADLPTLAPPRRKGSEPPPPDKEKKIVEADDIDIELDAMLAVEEAAKSQQKGAEPATKIPSKPPPPQKLSAICTYGRYEVLGRIAFGGMAEIFLGRESTSVGASRYLVIKRILPHVADDDQFVQMFLDEARLAIQLNHPNICHIYEFGELEGSYFIAMEWVNGVPLGKLIRKARIVGGIPIEIGVRIVAQMAEALYYAHRAKDALGKPMGIVHRDVSPHNIMVAYDGQVKLLDFGIAKASSHTSKTEAGVVKGKFSYMAPEQCLGKVVDQRADVFALGICLYETITGQALYHKENEYETMRAVIHDPVPLMREVRKDVPEALEAILKKALEKKMEDRYQTAGELQRALEGWVADSRRVVNAGSVGEMMEELYEEQIKRGPLVDSTPFGQSFQRMKAIDRSSVSGSQPAVVTASQATAEVMPPARRPIWPLAAAAMVAVALGVGGVTWALMGAEDEVERVNTEPPAVPEVALPEPPPPAPIADPEPQVTATVGRVRIESSPAGARVMIGDRESGNRTPLTMSDMPPGSHHVILDLDGHERFETDIEVVAGEEARIEATLTPTRVQPVGPPGRLSINTRPWSKVYVGRQLLGTTPIAEARVTSGQVRLRLVDRDGRTHTRQVRVPPNTTQRVFFDLAE
jgi:serine/threonine protein kinase